MLSILENCRSVLHRLFRLKVPEPNRWCLVGNIIEEHELANSEQVLKGTKQFRPGTKVYCLPPQWGDGYEKVVVVGIARKPRRWITMVMPTKLIANWRVKQVFTPAVLKRLQAGFDGFNAQWKSKKEVEQWAAGLQRHYGKSN